MRLEKASETRTSTIKTMPFINLGHKRYIIMKTKP